LLNCLLPRPKSQTATTAMSSRGRNEKRVPTSDGPLGPVPVTATWWAASRGARPVSFRAVGTWEWNGAPPSSDPLTEPVSLIVAEATLFAVTSATNVE
jgi:hypothetical protein